MANTTTAKTESGHLAAAKALNLPVSTKHCIEICSSLRYKDLSHAKKYLEEVADLKRPVSFKKFVRNTGHKAGMSTGRYPAKAAMEILKLLKSVEANAHFKGLNTGSLKITKLVANRAPNPFGGGRHRVGSKRTHVEVEVKERGTAGKKAAESKTESKHESKTAEPVTQKKKESVRAEAVLTETVNEKVVKHESKHEHTHTAAHEHAVHEHKHDDKHVETPAKSSVKVKTTAENISSEEPSSSELLRRAQMKAAELKRQEKERKDTEQVTHLYEELQKKGSLRSAGVRK